MQKQTCLFLLRCSLFSFFRHKDSKSLCISRYILQTNHFQEKFSDPIVFIMSRIVKGEVSCGLFRKKKRHPDAAGPEETGG